MAHMEGSLRDCDGRVVRTFAPRPPGQPTADYVRSRLTTLRDLIQVPSLPSPLAVLVLASGGHRGAIPSSGGPPPRTIPRHGLPFLAIPARCPKCLPH